MIRQVKVGEQFPDLLHNSRLLPVGSAVGGSGYSVRVVAPNLLLDEHGRFVDGYYLNSPQRLTVLPEGESVSLPQESEAQFKWRLRDAALAAAERASVRIEPVLEMLRDIGAPEPRLTLGGVVSSSYDLRYLPPGSVLYAGHPSRPEFLSVFKLNRDRYPERVLGTWDKSAGSPLTIRSAPELPPVNEDEVAEETTLARIALSAWRIGKGYKRRQSWCTTFENTLAALGIDDKSISQGTGESMRGPGDQVGLDGAALLPEDSLLWWQWQSDPRKWAVYRRVNTGTRTRSRTIRVAGNGDSLANSHKDMIILRTPQEPLHWRVSGTVLRTMPGSTTYLDDQGVQHSVSTGSPDPWRSYLIVSFPGVV